MDITQKKNRDAKKDGFTLIELLAVITIMGILMLVAIPAVSRTIENSRRDTFANLANTYLKSLKNSISNDELVCYSSGDTTTMKSILIVPDGLYCVNLSTYYEDSTHNWNYPAEAYRNTEALLENGAKSPWGNSNMRGYVLIEKKTTDNKVDYSYKIKLVDQGKHGISETSANAPISRAKVRSQTSSIADAEGPYINNGERLNGNGKSINVCKILN